MFSILLVDFNIIYLLIWFKQQVARRLVLVVEGYFPFFGLLVISLRLGYLKAVSTSCWQTVSISEVFSSLNYSVVLKSN